MEREKFLARMAGQCLAPRIAEQVRERIIPVWYVSSHNNDFCGELLAADPPDLLVLGGTRIIRETILDVPLIATVNAHPGLLPTLRGSSSVGWALYKDLATGCDHALCRYPHRRRRYYPPPGAAGLPW